MREALESKETLEVVEGIAGRWAHLEAAKIVLEDLRIMEAFIVLLDVVDNCCVEIV